MDSNDVLVIETRNYTDGNYTEFIDGNLRIKIENYLGIHGILVRLYVLNWCEQNYKEEIII
jgi:hypothetical protein